MIRSSSAVEQVAVNHKVGGSNPLSGAKRTCFRQVFFNALWLHAKHAFATGKQQPPVAERLRNDEVGLNHKVGAVDHAVEVGRQNRHSAIANPLSGAKKTCLRQVFLMPCGCMRNDEVGLNR